MRRGLRSPPIRQMPCERHPPSLDLAAPPPARRPGRRRSRAVPGLGLGRLAGFTLFLHLVLAVGLSAETLRLFVAPSVPAADPTETGAPESAWPVEVDLDLLATNPHELTMAWPGGRRLRASRQEVQRRPEGLSWRGRLEGGGGALLAVHSGVAAGVFFTADAWWTLEPEPAGGYLLRPMVLDGVELCGGAVRVPDLERRDRPEPRASRTGGGASTARIDILVLYTEATLEAVGGRAAFAATAQSWVDVVNVAFATSEIDARARLVHLAPIPREPAVTDSSIDLLRYLRRDRQVGALRDEHGADYVSLVYERSRGACGRAFVMEELGPGFADSAVSVVQRGCATPITFVHELGHVLGSHHHPEEGGRAVFPYAYGHWDRAEDRQTVMSARLDCCPQQPYFSNPRVVAEGGWRTGVADERDNARAFAETAPVVAAFRDAPCDLPTGDPDYCRECGPCDAGEGDCDGDAECVGGLECVRRAGRQAGFSRKTDVCLPATPADCPLEPGDPDYCAACGPCGRGEGDCDGNPECASGLTCFTDQGARFGLPPDVDICDVAPPTSPECVVGQDPGDPFYCGACGPCQLGEGNCRQDQECASFLTCVGGAGPDHGFGADVAVCLFPEPADACPVDLGSRRYCRKCGPCDEGEGGCRKDKHCEPGMVCVRRAGPEFGFGKKIGVCLPPD